MNKLVLVTAQLGHDEQFRDHGKQRIVSQCTVFVVYLGKKKMFVKMRSSLFEPQLQNGCHQAHLHRDSPLHVCFSQMMQNQSVLIHHAHGDMCAVADHADHSQW